MEIFGPIDATLADKVRETLATASGDLLVAINSRGGCAAAGLAMCQALQSYERGQVVALIEGCCLSAATIIACGADRILADRDAIFLIHAAHTHGQPDPLGIAAVASAEMKRIYASRLGCAAADVERLLAAGDVWLTADDARELGLVDEVRTYPQAA